MTSPIDSNDMSDARLVAYIDGELSPAERATVARALEEDPELRERVEFLDSGGRNFGSAFDLLLDAAPDDRLQAMFAGLVNGETASSTSSSTSAAEDDEKVVPFPQRRRPGGLSPAWQFAVAASFALTVFGGGIITGVLYGPKPPVVEVPQTPQTAQQTAQRNWMDAVAQYVSMFSVETLAGMPADPAVRQEGLQRVSTALGKDITHEKVAGLPMLDFRGTQLLQLEGRPIAQIAFQSETGKPVAICIIKTPRPAEEPTTDRRQGLNIVHWVAGGYGYMVIGDVPQDALNRISEAARAQLS